MALSDISYVTRTLMNLIAEAFSGSTAWTAGNVNVFPEPPNRNNLDGIGFYLYHATENAHYKNLPIQGVGRPPVRFNAMALTLYFQLSAHSSAVDGSAPFQEQLMMGIAMKGLHDYPQITDTTTVNGAAVMDANIIGRSNIFKISMLPITQNESVHYWTAGDSATKLACYYEVSVVLLDPDEIQSRIGRVLSYGVHVSASGAPKILSSQNTISFLPPPGETGNRSIKLIPAQASPNSGTDDSLVILSGNGMQGNVVELLLIHARWAVPGVANNTWQVSAAGSKLSFVAQESIPLQSLVVETILPGIYAAQIRTVVTKGTTETEYFSNQCPFSIVPRITNVSAPAPVTNIFTVTGFIFQHNVPEPLPGNPANTRPLQLEIYIGAARLGLASGALSAGEYVVDNAATIRFIVPVAPQLNLNAGDVVPLRVLVEGMESMPRWITVP